MELWAASILMALLEKGCLLCCDLTGLAKYGIPATIPRILQARTSASAEAAMSLDKEKRPASVLSRTGQERKQKACATSLQVKNSSTYLVAPLLLVARASRATLKGLTMPKWW